MLNPTVYKSDCMEILGKHLDHKFPKTVKQGQEWKKKAEKEWKKVYGDVDFELDFKNSNWSSKPLPSDNPPVCSYNLKNAVLRQRDFFYNVCLSHFRDDVFMKDAVKRYTEFLKVHVQLIKFCKVCCIFDNARLNKIYWMHAFF